MPSSSSAMDGDQLLTSAPFQKRNMAGRVARITRSVWPSGMENFLGSGGVKPSGTWKLGWGCQRHIVCASPGGVPRFDT